MRGQFRTPLFVMLLTIGTLGCTDESEPVPAYLNLQPFVVNAAGDAGWHKITDGWLYVNGEFLGAYTLPATVPVLAEGDSEIQLFPGVKENGIAATPNIYPFMRRFVQRYTLTPGATETVQPLTEYDPSAVFPWALERCSFDGGASLQIENRDTDPSNFFQINDAGAPFGKSILMQVDSLHGLMEIATEAVALPATYEREVWLELHYSNDVPFYLYLTGKVNGAETNQPVFQFNETENGGWNKIYINLTEALISLQYATEYRLFFQLPLPLDSNGKVTQYHGAVRLDNMRLVHF